MAKMMNRLLKTGVCCCGDCGGPDSRGRAWEKQDWMREVDYELARLEPVRTEGWAYLQPCNEIERMSDISWWNNE